MRKAIAPLAGTLALSVALATTVTAAEPARMNVENEIAALKAEVAALRAKDSDSWLNERRKEEVKALIHEVLQDADSRASMQSGGAVAGYNKGFFIASEDGNFLLRLAGRIQFRYIADFSEGAGSAGSPADESETGFTMRRTKLEWFGHIYDPKLQYKVVGAFDRGNGSFLLEESYVTYWFADQHYVQAGQYKGPFIREELVSSKRQLTAERSHVAEMFTLDYNQNAEIGGEYDSFRWRLALHDGREGDNIDFAADNTDFAIAGRAEYRIAGSWKQFDDFTVWSSDAVGIMLGAAFDYENGEGGDGGGAGVDWEHMLQYTGDVSVEWGQFTFFAAYVGRFMEIDPGQGGILGASRDDLHQWGAVIQASYFVVPDKLELFARYEYLDFDGAAEVSAESGRTNVAPLSGLGGGVADNQQIWTFGANYYVYKHDMKFTADVLWAPDGIRAGESGEGTITSNRDESDQISLRLQMQLLF